MLPSLGLPRLSWMLLSCLMLLSQVQGEDSQRSERISCPRGSIAYGSSCYVLYKAARSWMNANIACQRRHSGHLASVLSGTEGSFLASLVSNNLNTHSDVWIGLHDPTEGSEPNAGGWEWSSTDVFNYFAWERIPAAVSRLDHCGVLSRTSGYLKWKSYNCNVNLPYVCKFKG
ncbi:lithostathine-like [Bubalus bubalis]|uniref:lithostathine-like n=1 Tax=Bubalus bubalis TaxID=89462 RepID=UPI00042CB1D7|nr:lithostathine-like [Bubalus bubalis]